MSQGDLFAQQAASATFSPCRRWRYTLRRQWADGPELVFVMLNPSTADEFILDPTVTRCRDYAKREGAGGLLVLNIMSWRSTKPNGLLDVDDPVGPENHDALLRELPGAWMVIAAWGTHKATRLPGAQRSIEIVKSAAAGRLYCLKVSKKDQPYHPLYQRADQEFMPWPTTC